MYKTLIVDDEQSVHVAIRALIDWPSLCAEAPVSAFNGKEGLDCMEQLHPDVAFVDMNMPLMGGEELLRVAARNHPYCRLIVVSGYDDFRYAQAAIRYGAVDYVLKPIDGDELLRALKKALDSLPEREPSSADAGPDEVIVSVKDYIDHHFGEDIKMEELADRFFFSKEYLNKLFRNRFGCPIYEYVLQVRMDKAVEWLANPRMTIQEIAEKLGYSNANYFSKAFKHRYGKAPSEFRESAPEL